MSLLTSKALSPEVFSNIQSLLVVKLIDAITSQAITTPAILSVSLSSTTLGENFPFIASQKLLSAGMFVFYGKAESCLPQHLPDAELVSFTISVTALHYQDAILSVDLPASQLKVTEQEVLTNLKTKLIEAPLIQDTLELQPQAVALQGLVIQDNDPSDPAVNAIVSIVEPAVGTTQNTDASGRFRFSELPVEASVLLSIEFSGETSNFRHFVEFSTPLNQITVSVNG